MLRWHEDRDRFREALSFTEAETLFPARLVEKDYYCTVLLEYLSGNAPGLVFKGGTCLAKVRAALSRREVAARDFFDLDYAVRKLGRRADGADLIALVQQKLAVPGNAPVDVSESRLLELRQQVETQLRPVLRAKDFAEFDVERAFRIVIRMAEKVS